MSFFDESLYDLFLDNDYDFPPDDADDDDFIVEDIVEEDEQDAEAINVPTTRSATERCEAQRVHLEP